MCVYEGRGICGAGFREIYVCYSWEVMVNDCIRSGRSLCQLAGVCGERSMQLQLFHMVA